MSDVKKPRVLVRNDEEPGPWIYCGTLPSVGAERHSNTSRMKLRRDVRHLVGEMVLNEIEADMGGTDSDVFRLEVRVKEMTDAEVDAMPED